MTDLADDLGRSVIRPRPRSMRATVAALLAAGGFVEVDERDAWPDAPGDRRHVYERLMTHALDHPDREVLIKPRHRPGEAPSTG